MRVGGLIACAAGVVAFLGLAAAAPASAVPVNDNYASALPIALNSTVTGDNTGATLEASETMHAGRSAAHSIWYTYTPATSGLLALTTKGSTLNDTILAVYTGATVAARVDADPPYGSNDDEDAVNSVRTSKVVFQAVAGTKYYIAVDGYAAAIGGIQLRLYPGHIVGVGVVPSVGGTATVNASSTPIRAGHNDLVLLSATATAPYGFVSWTEGSRLLTSSTSLYAYADADTTFVATFADTTQQYTITLTKSGLGTTSGGGTFHGADDVTAVATPGSGYSFSNWTENFAEVSTQASYSFRASASRTLRANFVPNYQLTVSASPAAAGTVTGGGLFPYGSAQTIEAVATKPNYGFEAWTEEGALFAESRYAQVTMTGALRFVANFIGPEFRINTFKPNDQYSAAVVVLKDGTSVVVWQSMGVDGSKFGISGQRYSAKGKAIGKEFRVNTTKKNDQVGPAMAALTGGGFVVVWASEQDPALGIYGQRFGANGKPVGGEFHVNTYKKDVQTRPKVAALNNGGFVVVWDSKLQDKSDFGVYAQIFDGAGARAGTEFRVNPMTKDFQSEGNVATLAGGDFVVVWTSHSAASEYDIFGQRYSAAGVKKGVAFLINNTKRNWQYGSSIAGLKDGGFIVAWSTFRQESAGLGVMARRYKANGKPSGNEFTVALPSMYTDANPVTVGLPNGGFVIGWDGGHDFSGSGVYAQRFHSTGLRIGRTFRVNPTWEGNQSGLVLAARADNSTFAAWESGGQDGSGYGIYGVWKGP